MALPYPQPDPATGVWDPFALLRDLQYLDDTSVKRSAATGSNTVSRVELLFKSANQTVNNSSTLVNDTALLAQIQNNTQCLFIAYIRYHGDVTADIKMTFSQPSGAFCAWTIANSIQITTADALVATPDFAAGSTLTLGTTASNRGVVLVGIVNGSTTATTPQFLQFKWAQDTPVGADTVVAVGSSLLVLHKPL
jgi:hypothetical protein